MEDEIFQQHLVLLGDAGKSFSIEEEFDFYCLLREEMEKEEDKEINSLMKEMIDYYMLDTTMNLKYFYKEIWKISIREKKQCQINLYPISVYLALEKILASHVDTTAYTRNDLKRYPLRIPLLYGSEFDPINNPGNDLSRFRFLESYYQIGSHRYLVGAAINQILDDFEIRYGLDFDELERSYQKKDPMD